MGTHMASEHVAELGIAIKRIPILTVYPGRPACAPVSFFDRSSRRFESAQLVTCMQGLHGPLRALRFESIWDNTVTLLKEALIATEAFGEVYTDQCAAILSL